MSAHQIETAYLRRVILYDNGDERRKLEKNLAQVQRSQRCVERVSYLAALLLLVAIAGVAYEAILQENFPHGGSGLFLELLCCLGLASLICLLGFAGLLTIYRLKLNRLRKECLQLVVTVLESHLGKPVPKLPSSHRVLDDGEPFPKGYI